MQRRQITLEDGRYLIFYTFDEAAAASPAHPRDDERQAGATQPDGRRAEPDAEPQATEEKRV